MNDTVVVRDAVPEDYEGILRLNEADVEVLSPLDPSTLARMAACAEMFQVAEAGEELAGFLVVMREGSGYWSDNYKWFEGRYSKFLYVDRVVVDDRFRGCGIAKRLYQGVIDRACRANVPRITAEVDIEPIYNEPSIRFHSSMGFMEVGTKVFKESIVVSLQVLELVKEEASKMKSVLVVSGHPRLDNDSVANAAIVRELSKLDGYTVDRLDALYSDYKIDVEAEQEKLVGADVIVLQYPVFWYGMPALLQKWMEDVFAHGFSHGSKGKALVGKKLVVSMTVGAPEEAYAQGAAVQIADLLKPAKGACALTGMEFAGYEYTCGVSYASRVDDAAREAIAKKGLEQAARVATLVEKL